MIIFLSWKNFSSCIPEDDSEVEGESKVYETNFLTVGKLRKKHVKLNYGQSELMYFLYLISVYI